VQESELKTPPGLVVVHATLAPEDDEIFPMTVAVQVVVARLLEAAIIPGLQETETVFEEAEASAPTRMIDPEFSIAEYETAEIPSTSARQIMIPLFRAEPLRLRRREKDNQII
jgi:hypothetical protein